MTGDVLVALLGFFTALIVGVTSVGGVLVVPALVFGLGVDIHTAISAALLSFLPSAIVTLVVGLRRGTLERTMCAALWLGALPGALVGALALPWVPADALLWLIVVLLIVSALRSLAVLVVAGDDQQRLSAPVLATIGMSVGAVSAITGTGGAVSLMPILAWRHVAPLTAVVMCQTITVPISAFATLGNAMTGTIDLRIASILAVAQIFGIFVGVRIAHALPVAWLQRAVALMMIVSGIAIAVRLLWR